MDFSSIAAKYQEYSSVQKSAGELLLSLLDIGPQDDVLDLGCGVGHLTRRIRAMTKGKVTGIDPSEGMIREAREQSRNLAITFEIKSAEEMGYKDCFDGIFCNSSLQWFRDAQKAIQNCHNALRKGGRVGVQAPARRVYSPNFIGAVQKVKDDPRTRDTFAHFRKPWFFLETAEEYQKLFETTGFHMMFSKIEAHKTNQTPEEVFNTFSSGAIAGYLNQDFYDVPMTEDYIEQFKGIVKAAFVRQADAQGFIKLSFNRIFLLVFKE